MGHKNKINELALIYFHNGKKEEDFNRVYFFLKKGWSVEIPRYAYNMSVDKDDLESHYMSALIDTLKKFNGKSDFENYLNSSLAKKRDFVLRTTIRRKKRFELTVDKQIDDDAPTFEIADDYDLEEEVFSIKKEDQRQLISSLINDPRQVDTETIEIVTAFSKHKSITALAKALGLHHEVVKRKLRKLERNFCESTFGDYRQYLSA